MCFFAHQTDLSLLLLIPVPFLILREEGTEFNFETSRVRRYKRRLFRRVGNWENLDSFDGVFVRSDEQTGFFGDGTGELGYELWLTRKNGRNLFILATGDRDVLIKLRDKLQGLGLKKARY